MQEYYAAVTWDGRRKKPVIIFSDMGGIDIEEVAETAPRPRVADELLEPAAVLRLHREGRGRQHRRHGQRPRTAHAHRLGARAACSCEYDLTLAEINPIGKLEDGTFLALDAHVDMEDDARDKQRALLAELAIADDDTRQARPPTEFEIAGAQVDASDPRGVAGRVVEFDGDIGLVIGAGGGSLTLFDAVRSAGGKPANYCEIGGNPTVKKACGADEAGALEARREEDRRDDERRLQHARRHRWRAASSRAASRPGATRGHHRHLPHPGVVGGRGIKILSKYGVEYFDRTVSMYEAAAPRRRQDGG